MTTAAILNKTADEPLWSTPDVARFLGCSERQVHVLRKQGLPAVRVGNLIRFVPGHVHAWLSECDARVSGSRQDADRRHQLADIAATGDEDNAEVSRDELERRSFDHRDIRLPVEGMLTWSLLCRIPACAHVISLTCNPDGSSVFTGQTGDPDERHRIWAAIRDAGADQRNCVVTMDGRVSEAMARPFPADPEERERDLKLRSALLSGQPAPPDTCA